jgi:two-component system LytT family response regulator
MTAPVRIVVADDERPARRFLIALLKHIDGVELAGEAATGTEAVSLIESARPDLALLDLQMPELGGLDVVRRLPAAALPLVAFVTAYDDFAVDAFELNAIDYLLKPVQSQRLMQTVSRARERLRHPEPPERRAAALAAASAAYDRVTQGTPLDRLPLRRGEEVFLVPVRQIASIVAEGELLHVTLGNNDRFAIAHPLHALERRLDSRRFIRLGRGTLANVDFVTRLSPMPGGTYVATLSNGQELAVSRLRSRALRETMLKL